MKDNLLRAVRLIAFTALSVSNASWGQATSPSISPSTPARPSTAMAYRLFFGHVVFLDEEATKAEQAGKQGVALRNHYKFKIRLQDKDERALLSRARGCENEVATHDAKTARIIEGLWSRIPKDKTPADLPVPQEVFQLQAERDAILERHLNGLKSDLTAEGFGRVDSFVRGEFSRRSTVRPVAEVQLERFDTVGAGTPGQSKGAERRVVKTKR